MYQFAGKHGGNAPAHTFPAQSLAHLLGKRTIVRFGNIRHLHLGGVEAAAGAQVQAVRGELARVLRNLIDNAIAHSPVAGEVEVAIAILGRELELVVTDAGPGVAPEDRPHIFAPFYRGLKDAPEGQVGAGLGLSIARTIARGAGGELTLDESHTRGARFVVRLPLA